jgi:hypothetical protein
MAAPRPIRPIATKYSAAMEQIAAVLSERIAKSDAVASTLANK